MGAKSQPSSSRHRTAAQTPAHGGRIALDVKAGRELWRNGQEASAARRFRELSCITGRSPWILAAPGALVALTSDTKLVGYA